MRGAAPNPAKSFALGSREKSMAEYTDTNEPGIGLSRVHTNGLARCAPYADRQTNLVSPNGRKRKGMPFALA